MPSNLIALERMEGKIIALHHINRAGVGEPGFYRATMSSEAFRSRELNRVYGPKTYSNKSLHHHHFIIHRLNEWQAEQDALRVMMTNALAGVVWIHEHDNKPVYNHESIWAFYKAIGYDYKKKRYV